MEREEEDGSNMVMFVHSHQEPSCRVILEPLRVLARSPNEKCVAIVQSGGDRGVD